MSNVEESLTRVYTINLRRAWITPEHKRTDRVVNMIRQFAVKHMKSDDVKLDQDVNRQLWSRGKTDPPRKVRVKMVKDEDDVVTISLYEDAPVESAASSIEPKAEASEPAASVPASELPPTSEVKAEK